MKLITSLLLACTAFAHAGVTVDTNVGFLTGRYRGSFTCGNDVIPLTLDVADFKDGRTEGIFYFGGGGYQRGSYRFTAHWGPNGTVNLIPRSWIDRPPNTQMVGANVLIRDENVVGTMNDPTCQQINVTFETFFDQLPPLLASQENVQSDVSGAMPNILTTASLAANKPVEKPPEGLYAKISSAIKKLRIKFFGVAQ